MMVFFGGFGFFLITVTINMLTTNKNKSRKHGTKRQKIHEDEEYIPPKKKRRYVK